MASAFHNATHARQQRLARQGDLLPRTGVGRVAIWFAQCDLTHREEQVAWMLVAGLTAADIAAQLYVEVHTVKSHMIAVYRKCGIVGYPRKRVPFLNAVLRLIEEPIEEVA